MTILSHFNEFLFLMDHFIAIGFFVSSFGNNIYITLIV